MQQKEERTPKRSPMNSRPPPGVTRTSPSLAKVVSSRPPRNTVFDPATRRLLTSLAGTHRIQRVPATEKRGRRHSSIVVVAVLENTNPGLDVRVDPRDVRVDTYRSSGAGGQHRNKTDSAIRLTHLPTGVVVTAAEERSQHQNREVAWRRLHERLSAEQSGRAAEAVNDDRQAAFDGGRAWVWTGWRDEVRSPDGAKAPMKKVLAGRFGLLR